MKTPGFISLDFKTVLEDKRIFPPSNNLHNFCGDNKKFDILIPLLRYNNIQTGKVKLSLYRPISGPEGSTSLKLPCLEIIGIKT